LSSSKAPSGSGRPVGSPSRTERLINVPRDFIDESIEEEASPFIKKLLYTNQLITPGELYKWAKEPEYLLSDINLIITSYWDTLKKGVSYKTSYKDTKSLLENIKLYNTKLEEDIKRYIVIIDRLIAALATPALSVPAPSIPTPLDPSLKSPVLSHSYSRLGSPILQASNRGARVAKLPDLTLFTRDYTVFDDWLIQIKNKL
jgi:hypothetical protein